MGQNKSRVFKRHLYLSLTHYIYKMDNNYYINHGKVKAKLIPMGHGNDWALYLLFDESKDSNYLESKLGSFDLYLAVNKSLLTIIVHSLSNDELITLYADVNDIQFVLVKNQRITHFAVSYSDNYPLSENHVYAVTPKYEVD